MKSSVLWACALVFLVAGAARGQQPDQDPIGQSFFAPELAMQHQEAIGLNEEQKTYLKTEIRQAQLRSTRYFMPASQRSKNISHRKPGVG